MKTYIEKIDDKYHTVIRIENQIFSLPGWRCKKDAIWHKKQFDKAIKEEMERYYKTERQKEKDVFL